MRGSDEVHLLEEQLVQVFKMLRAPELEALASGLERLQGLVTTAAGHGAEARVARFVLSQMGTGPVRPL
jgi:hypothetical protein